MGDIITASGTQVFISSAATASTIDTAIEFAGLTWVEIGLIESVGEFGDEASIVTFAAIGDGRIRKSKGARDAGTMAITTAHDRFDLGQSKAVEAEATNDNYGFKVILPDAPTASYIDSTLYFRGLVASKRKNIGTNDNVVRNTFNCAINSEIITVAVS